MKNILFLCVVSLLLFGGCVKPTADIQEYSTRDKSALPVGWDKIDVVLLDHLTDIEFCPSDERGTVFQKDIRWHRVNRVRLGGIQELRVHEQSTFEKPVKIKAKAYYPDGTVWSLRSKDIFSTRESLTNSVTHSFFVPDYQEGLLVKVVVERQYLFPEFTGRYLFRGRFPIVKRTVNLTFPDAADLVYGIENGEKADIDWSLMGENGSKVIRYSADRLPTIRERELTERPETFYAALYVSFPPAGMRSYSWQELGDYYLHNAGNVYAMQSDLGPSYQLADKMEPLDKIRILFERLVQAVRYHCDARGRFAYYSRPVSTILENGFGDCKEMSTLLKVLLKKNKIESNLVLLATENHFQLIDNYPGLYCFNHVILSASYGEGKQRYLDPTCYWGSADNSYYSSVGRKGFLLKPNGSQVVTISPGESFESRVVTKSIVSNGEHPKIQGTVALYGEPALHFNQYLQEPLAVQDSAAINKYLSEFFDIPVLHAEMVSTTKNQVILAYTGRFGQNVLKVGQGGVRLDFPRLHKQMVNSNLDEISGSVHLSGFSQQDSWELQFDVNSDTVQQHSSSLAAVFWKAEKKTLSRHYSQQDMTLRNTKRVPASWLDYIQTDDRNIVWKK